MEVDLSEASEDFRTLLHELLRPDTGRPGSYFHDTGDVLAIVRRVLVSSTGELAQVRRLLKMDS